MKLVLGTKNPGKLKELFHLASAFDELELELAPDNFAPEETGQSYMENALIKAQEAARLTSQMSLGEDSGIEVDALEGKPGIYSARYIPGTDTDRCRKLLEDLNYTPPNQRGAAYVCAMALVSPTGQLLHQAIGRWPGEIALSESGENGFGYDPIFYLPEQDCTVAELATETKNQISHRAQAWRSMLQFLNELDSAKIDKPINSVTQAT